MKFIVTIILAILLAAPAIASAARCSNGFIYVGDAAGKVLKRCGKPQYKTVTKMGVSSREEKWYYDFGGNTLPFTVIVRDGKVIKIED